MGRISFTSLIKYFIAVMLTIGLVLFVVLFRIPSNVEHALEQAGVNRSEMEQVLAHYRFKNLRKYQSACFLIANMPYHKSKETIHLSIEYVQYLDSLNTIYDRLFSSMTTDSILKVTPKHMDELRKSLGQQYNAIRYSEVKANDRSDIHLVKAAFLIDHIDRAFESWEVNPLTKNLKFDEFKEFVLPYRSTNEELIVDRSTLRKQWESILAKDGYGHIELPLKRLKAFVGKCRWLSYFTKPSGHVGIFDLILPKFRMNCHRLTNWSVNILRSCGVPTVYETNTAMEK